MISGTKSSFYMFDRRFLKVVSTFLSSDIREVFNKSLSPGGISSINWLLFDAVNCNDFRPISKFLAKALEEVVYSQLVSFISDHSTFEKFQCGFHTLHSTWRFSNHVENCVGATGAALGRSKRSQCLLVISLPAVLTWLVVFSKAKQPSIIHQTTWVSVKSSHLFFYLLSYFFIKCALFLLIVFHIYIFNALKGCQEEIIFVFASVYVDKWTALMYFLYECLLKIYLYPAAVCFFLAAYAGQ